MSKASNELITAFEGIGFKEKPLYYEDDINIDINGQTYPRYTLDQLQEFLWKEKGLFANGEMTLNHGTVENNNIFIAVVEKVEHHKRVVLYESDILYDTPSEALNYGLLRAVQIVKERSKQ